VVERDVGVRASDALARAEEEAVAQFEDVRFMDASDALAALATGRVEGEAGDSLGGGFSDHAQALDNAGHDLVLQSAIKPFGVFADDDQVDVFIARRYAGERLGGPVVGVELEPLAELDVDAAEADAAGRGGRAF